MLLDPILASGIITQWDFKMYSIFIWWYLMHDSLLMGVWKGETLWCLREK